MRLSITSKKLLGGLNVGKEARCGLAFVVMLLGGCASNMDAGAPYDPLEPLNRRVFAFNHSLDNHAALPAATYYRSAVPGGARDGVHNFLSNLSLPVTIANEVLQGEATLAVHSACRFGINTTIGVLGVMDPAVGMGYPEQNEDFGQTLAVYGVPGGPYMVLPLIGSTVPRDAFGKIFVDHFFNPLGYVAYRGKLYVSLSQNLINTVDRRSRSIARLSDVERNSVDYYAAMRTLYLQRRDTEVHNGDVAPAAVNP